MSNRVCAIAACSALLSVVATMAADPPPGASGVKSPGIPVATLNAMFKKDTDGTAAKRFTGKAVTISGTVKDVQSDENGATLTLAGAAGNDTGGCTIAFPAKHPSLKLVKGLTAGSGVRIRGEIDSVTGAAFALKNPVLVGITGAPAGKELAAGPKPSPGGTPKPGTDPTPAKSNEPVLMSVAAINSTFRKGTTSPRAQEFLTQPLLIVGTVKDISVTDEGATLTFAGPADAPADDPGGCTIAFPLKHPSLDLVKRMKAGSQVRLTGRVDTVTKSAFTVKDALVTSATRVAPPAQIAGGPKTPNVPPTPVIELKPEDLKTTVLELTTKLRDDKTENLWLAYTGKMVELTGKVEYSNRGSAEFGSAWALGLVGCSSGNPEYPYTVRMSFPADHPDLARLRNVVYGDTVTVRGEFGISIGTVATLKQERLLAGGEKPPAPLAPVRTAEAEAFVKELLTDKAAAEKVLGKAVELTGTIASAGPPYSEYGLILSAGKLKPADSFSIVGKCIVDDDQVEPVGQLPFNLKVRVVGVVKAVQKDQVVLVRCRVTLREPNGMPTLTVADLAAAFKADPKAAGEKYGRAYAEKPLYLTGEVASMEPNSFGNAKIVSLKVQAGLKVSFPAWNSNADKLTVGQSVRLKATCHGLSDDGTTVHIHGVVLPEAKTKLPIEK